MGVPLPQLKWMAERAAPLTHPQYNRRYHQYGFSMYGAHVDAVGLLGPDLTKPGRRGRMKLLAQRAKQFLVWEPCSCTTGCDQCVDGEVPVIRTEN